MRKTHDLIHLQKLDDSGAILKVFSQKSIYTNEFFNCFEGLAIV